MDDKDIERMWSNVAIGDGCWFWLGQTDEKDGYGVIKIKRRQCRVHRAAWESWFGYPPPRRVLMHKCDQPACCRPSHLVPGTQRDNMRDKYAKGRHGMKLDREKVQSIRGLYKLGGFTHQDLAVMYGVKPLAIYDVIHRNTWSDVE